MIKSRSAACYLSYFLSAQMRRSREAHPLRTPKSFCAKFWQVKVPAESGHRRPTRHEVYDLWRSTNPELERETSAGDVDRTRDSSLDYPSVSIWGTSSQPLLSSTHLAVDFRDSFRFCSLVDVPAQGISSEHSLDNFNWRRAVSIDPRATRSSP